MNRWLAAWFLWPINCSTCSTCPACPGTALLTIPLWVFLGNKTSKRHIYLVGAILSCDRSSLLRCFFVDKPVIFGGPVHLWQRYGRNVFLSTCPSFLAAVDLRPRPPLRQTYSIENLHIISQKIINSWFKWTYSWWNDPTFLGGDLPY